ncbi:MAG TPA: hypothetical protein PKD85_19435, partial [Saprospiraceae bacterium]|nr:hypothetical protein [Saprospiraceae bacterium]
MKNVKQAKQNPVVMGTETIVLNQFKPIPINQNNTSITAANINIPTSLDGSRGVIQESEYDALSEKIKYTIHKSNSFRTADYISLSKKTPNEINRQLLNQLYAKNVLPKVEIASSRANQLIAKALYEKVQNVIDLYLMGDEAELEKRRYYNEVEKPYDEFPYMIEIAIKMLPKDHYLIPSLQMQKAYLTGLAIRLKIPFTKDYLPLLASALKHQLAALALEPNAAFIHNELGILYRIKGIPENAKVHFEKAHSLAPLWPLPISNLANVYFDEADYTNSKKSVDLAIQMQNTLQNPYIVDGNLYAKDNNLLFAEELYHKAIKINTRHFLPYEKLGNIYLKTQDFEYANNFYLEAEKRKVGMLHVNDLISLSSNHLNLENSIILDGSYPLDTSFIDKENIITNFAWGKYFYDKYDYPTAKRWFEKVINVDINNPLVYYYLGHIAFYEKQYAKTEYFLKLSIKNHMLEN